MNLIKSNNMAIVADSSIIINSNFWLFLSVKRIQIYEFINGYTTTNRNILSSNNPQRLNNATFMSYLTKE